MRDEVLVQGTNQYADLTNICRMTTVLIHESSGEMTLFHIV